MDEEAVKPIFVMNQEGVSKLEKRAVLDGINELLVLGGVEGLVEVVDRGVWRAPDYIAPDGSLSTAKSIDYFLNRATPDREHYKKHFPHIGAEQILSDNIVCLLGLPEFRRDGPRYDVAIVREDVNVTQYGYPYISGQGRAGVGALISTFRVNNAGFDEATRYECHKSVAMHELGHMFSLIGPDREERDMKSGGHCLNTCVMRTGVPNPIEIWIERTEDRLKYGALCGECHDELRQYFGVEDGRKEVPELRLAATGQVR